MYAVTRVRGIPDRNANVSTILEQTGLDKRNSMVLMPETEEIEGMIKKVKDVVTYGRVSEEFIEELQDMEDVSDLVEKADSGEISLSELRDEGFSTRFSMNSPSKGYRNTKRQYKQGGSLGFRKNHEIEQLLNRM